MEDWIWSKINPCKEQIRSLGKNEILRSIPQSACSSKATRFQYNHSSPVLEWFKNNRKILILTKKLTLMHNFDISRMTLSSSPDESISISHTDTYFDRPVKLTLTLDFVNIRKSDSVNSNKHRAVLGSAIGDDFTKLRECLGPCRSHNIGRRLLWGAFLPLPQNTANSQTTTPSNPDI